MSNFKFGAYSAIIVGALSILYAIFFLVIAKQAEYIGTLGAWIILGTSGLFSSAAYVALYQRARPAGEALALWGLLLGVASSFATLMHGGYEALVVSARQTATGPARTAIENAGALPSQIDPAGLATFGVVGIVAFVFGYLITRGNALPKNLGYLGMFNAVLLVVLFFASATGSQTIILISGGLTSVIVGPIWWIWAGMQMLKYV